MSVHEIAAASDIGVAPIDFLSDLPSTALDDYRMMLETKGWSASTMHRDFFAHRPPDAAPSHGQCGVSSLWLVDRLRDRHAVAAAYCYGDVLSANDDSKIVARHCWVEVGADSEPSRIVIDLTWDQVGALNRTSVLCEPHDQLLRRESVNYAARIRMTRDELKADSSFWDRFTTMKKALGEELL